VSPQVALSGGSQGGEFTSAFGGAAELHGRMASAAYDANDPTRTWSVHRSSRDDVDLGEAREQSSFHRDHRRAQWLRAVRSTLPMGRMQAHIRKYAVCPLPFGQVKELNVS
jgi:hypothetical protein